MTDNFKQLQRWLENARAAQLSSALAAIAIALAFLVASVVLAPDDARESLAAGVGPGISTPGGQGGAPSADGATGGATSTAPGGATDGETSTGETSTGGDGGADTASVKRVASDRGVTEDTILLGALIPDKTLASLGFGTNIRGDFERYIQALADYLNRRGGVSGRTVEVTIRDVDPTSVSDQDAACQSMLNDRKVFGIADQALASQPAQACIAEHGETPLVHMAMWSTEYARRARGYDVSFNPATDRIARAVVRDLPAIGWIARGDVVGIFGDNCPHNLSPIRDVLVPGLKAAGATVEVGLHDCTIEGAIQQPPNIATRFRTAGVTKVVNTANAASLTIFLEAANSLGGWNPDYAMTDWFGAVSDSMAANFNANQFDGAIALTVVREPLINAGRPPHQGSDACNAAAVEAGLAELGAPDTDFHYAFCDQFLLLTDTIAATGPNPTRAVWAATVQQMGPRQSTRWGPSSFGPGKTDGADQMYTAFWRRDCRCYMADSGFRALG